MDIKTQLIQELAIELATVLELYEDQPDAWMPESLDLMDRAVAHLTRHGVPIPRARRHDPTSPSGQSSLSVSSNP